MPITLHTPGVAAALYALLAAVLWGGGDFSGGMGVTAGGGSLRAALRVIVTAHAASLAVLLLYLGLTHAAWPARTPLLWGLAAGLAGGLGLLAFYIALSRGAMGASAALSGLLAAAIPAAVSMAIEGIPSPLRLAGFALAAVAIWLIAASSPSGDPATQPTSGQVVWLAVAGGVGFGIYFVALRFANPAGVIEPMAMARVASLITCLLLLAIVSQSKPQEPTGLCIPDVWLSGRAWLWAMGVAVLDTGGNLLFVLATRTGRLDAAAVLASLYPASTILLAAVVLHERPRRQQVFGMGLAVVAVVLVAA